MRLEHDTFIYCVIFWYIVTLSYQISLLFTKTNTKTWHFINLSDFKNSFTVSYIFCVNFSSLLDLFHYYLVKLAELFI